LCKTPPGSSWEIVARLFRKTVEDRAHFGILVRMSRRFSELNKVRVTCERFGDNEGYVIASLFRDGKWIYKISISEDPGKLETFDNWIPEECLELAT
jgi:hypothetical protein